MFMFKVGLRFIGSTTTAGQYCVAWGVPVRKHLCKLKNKSTSTLFNMSDEDERVIAEVCERATSSVCEGRLWKGANVPQLYS